MLIVVLSFTSIVSALILYTLRQILTSIKHNNKILNEFKNNTSDQLYDTREAQEKLLHEVQNNSTTSEDDAEWWKRE